MSQPKPEAGRFTIEWRALALPISLGAMALLHYALHVPLWLLAALCAWIPAYYILYPAWVRKRWLRFEREFTRRFQRGEHKQLLEYYKSQKLLRRAGPRGEMLSKLGLIYAALARHREAEEVVQRAIHATPVERRERLYFSLANIKFELGKHEEAEAIYRALDRASPYRRAARTQLALIDLSRGRGRDEALKVLEQERDQAQGALRERIEEALAQGEARF